MDADLVTHVQDDGRFIQWVDRETVHRERLVHRSINVLVFHPDGRMLVQLRHRDKRTHPHHWDVSCAGHVDYADHPNGDPDAAQEAFWSSANREMQEELGLPPDSVLAPVGEFGPIKGIQYERVMIYRTQYSGPFTLQEEEVEAVQWIRSQDMERLSPCTPQLVWLAGMGIF
jgi:isopentenyl-diphosphate Delta-isomerase